MRHVLLIATLALTLGGGAACQPPKPPPPALTGTGMDMFAPTALHIHHLSRIVPPATTPAPATQNSELRTQSATLEARIELSDQFADTTKTTGTLRIDLFDQPPLTHKGPLLQSRTMTIATPQDHQAYWDRITRTYTFRFPVA